jgi:hypothetical protein
LFGIGGPDTLLSRFLNFPRFEHFFRDRAAFSEERDSLMTTARTNLEYLVVGTGRSGTLYAAKLLTAVGIPCGHERIFNGGDISNVSHVIEQGGDNSACGMHFGLEFEGRPIAESSYMAVPFLDHETLKDSTIIHVVRDPLKVIRSFLNNLLFFREDRPKFRHAQEQFLYDHLPHLEFLPDPVSRACFYYLRWNQIIEESIGDRNRLLYPIENGPETVLKFLGLTTGQVNLPDDSCNAYAKWPQHMRIATDLPAIAEEEIKACFLWKEVATLAKKYGYSHDLKGLHQFDRARITHRPIRASYSSESQTETPLCYPVQPRMVQEDFRNYNIIQVKDAFYAVHRDVGPLDLTQLGPLRQETLGKNGKLFCDSSLSGLKVQVQLFESEKKQESIIAELFKVQNQTQNLAQNQGSQTLDSTLRIEAELRNMNETLHRTLRQTEALAAHFRPWYRKLAGRLKHGWQSIHESVKSRFTPKQSSLPANG